MYYISQEAHGIVMAGVTSVLFGGANVRPLVSIKHTVASKPGLVDIDADAIGCHHIIKVTETQLKNVYLLMFGSNGIIVRENCITVTTRADYRYWKMIKGKHRIHSSCSVGSLNCYTTFL